VHHVAIMPVALLVLTAVLGAASIVVGLTVVRRSTVGASQAGSPGLQRGLPRLVAELHTGPEQVLVALARELPIERGVAELAYGQLYWEAVGDERLVIRSHSMIGRGLIAVVDLRRQPSSTVLRFAVIRLPGDDEVREALLRFEVALVGVLRRIDPRASVRLSGASLRDVDRMLEEHGAHTRAEPQE
jgi:hypothetical protein